MRHLPALALLAAAAAPPALAQTADRYGYAPAEAQVPMRQTAPSAPALRVPARVATPALRALAPVAAPPLRMLSWPGKAAHLEPAISGDAGLSATPALREDLPAARPQATHRTAWTTRSEAAPRHAAVVAVAPSVVGAPSTTAGVGPTPRPTFVAPPGLIAHAPAAPPPAVSPQAAPQGVAAMGPPRNPWYQRWPDAAAAPDPTVGSGVGASLAPGTPAAPPPASPLAGYAAAAAGAAPVRVASAAPLPRSTAKYYSVHTPYGHAPDPAPIPPQFFGPTADLSTPETPEPARATLTANATAAKAVVNAARLQQGAAE